MKLKFLFCILALCLAAVWGIILVFALKERGTLFYIAEGVVTFSLLFLVYFYRKTVKPLEVIGNGMDLLREQDFSSHLRSVGQAEADHIVQMFNRMMDQLKTERLRVREQNHFLDLLISVSPMGVIMISQDGHITMLNRAALRFLDYAEESEVTGHLLSELSTPLAEEIKRIPRESSETIRLSDSMIYRCSHLSFVDQGVPHPFILIESLTDEVVKAEKKAYEKVIRMIAHEVNNTTAGITSTLDTMDSALEGKEDVEDLHEVIRACIERCYGMSGFITRFADVVKIPEPELKLVDLNKRAEACKMFMENICHDHQIELHLDLCPENPQVRIDTLLFEQVLVNIIKNASESIGEKGDIYIRTSVSPTMLEIADTGSGISKEVEAKLFSPFFSTKPHGQGIGLVFIREVLMKHGCTFSLRTYPDGLTRFRIRF